MIGNRHLGRAGARFRLQGAGVLRTALATALAAGLTAGPAAGQSSRTAGGREVVQALPNPDTQRLNRALLRLATNPRDVEALIEAGRASLLVDDIDGAIGFFGRADSLQPGNPRAKMGLASAYVRTRRPVEALRLFAEVDRQGVAMGEFAGDRGLAYDLVGDHASAQAQYREALRYADDPAVSRRLAISQAISGDRKGFEATLAPMLKAGDNAAFRTRAFGLAILGRAEEAVAAAKVAMPPALASGLTPYLATMPRLSSAEQAAAVHMGVFPAQASARPAPAPPTQVAAAPASTAPRSRSRRGSRAEREAAGTRQAGTRSTRPETRSETRPQTRTAAASPSRTSPAAQPASSDRSTDGSRNDVAAPRSAATPVRVAADGNTPASRQTPPVRVAAATPSATAAPRGSAAAPSVRTGELPALTPRADARPTVSAPTGAGLAGPLPTGGAIIPAVAAPSDTSAPQGPVLDLEEAFADLAGPLPAPVTPAAGAVDITQLAVRRDPVPAKPEAAQPSPSAARPAPAAATPTAKPPAKPAAKPAAKPEAKPAPKPAKPAAKPAEAHPARLWVQLAAGRDREALRFDWKRLSRQSKGKIDKLGPFVARWGQTNRLLIGPFKDEATRRATVKTLEEAGLDTLPHSSSAGAVVEPLK